MNYCKVLITHIIGQVMFIMGSKTLQQLLVSVIMLAFLNQM